MVKYIIIIVVFFIFCCKARDLNYIFVALFSSSLPITWYRNDVWKKCLAAPKSQSGLLSLHLLTLTSKDDSYPQRHISWSQRLLFCVFSHRFLRDNKLLSCVTTVLTQRDSPGVEFFSGSPPTTTTFPELLHLHHKEKMRGSFSGVLNRNGLIRMAGYHSYCVLICFSQCGGSVSLYSLMLANVWEQTKMLTSERDINKDITAATLDAHI